MSSPPRDNDEPKTIFEYERRRRSLEPGEIVSDAYPRLPPSSPWASDPVPNEEPVDRTEDGPTIRMED
jgi:hypothetical protein